MTSIEENKAVVHQIIDNYNKGNPDAAHDLISEDCEILDWTGKLYKKQEFISTMKEFIAAVPDSNLIIEDVIAEGDKVVIRLTESGTMKGNFMGVEATGKTYTQPAIEIHQIENGKVIRLWTVRDILTAGTQMGMFPPME